MHMAEQLLTEGTIDEQFLELNFVFFMQWTCKIAACIVGHPNTVLSIQNIIVKG